MQRQCVKRLLSIDQNQTYEEFVSLNTKLLSVCQQLYDPADPSSAEELKKVTETLKNPKKFLNKKYENWIIASCVLGFNFYLCISDRNYSSGWHRSVNSSDLSSPKGMAGR